MGFLLARLKSSKQMGHSLSRSDCITTLCTPLLVKLDTEYFSSRASSYFRRPVTF